MGRYNNGYCNRANGCNPKLSILTVNLSDEIMDMLEYGKAKGWWCSRSEGIRTCLSRILPQILQEHEEMEVKVIESLQEEHKLDPKKNYVKIPGRGYIEIIGVA
jgi:metal-responsive CopG/Arc/MetJ family transcriptional regulator